MEDEIELNEEGGNEFEECHQEDEGDGIFNPLAYQNIY